MNSFISIKKTECSGEPSLLQTTVINNCEFKTIENEQSVNAVILCPRRSFRLLRVRIHRVRTKQRNKDCCSKVCRHVERVDQD